jgi:hypothetical protein
LIVPRGSSFQDEVEQEQLLETEDFKKVVESLPISVISIPWFQVQHLPDALVIGHEAGHVVEFDLNLSSRIKTILNDAMANEDVPLSHREGWRSWQSEIFADLWGTLCAGPAFTGCLLDFLAMDKHFIQVQKKTKNDWGDYPTIYMRVLLSLKTLELMNFADKSAELKQQWTQTFPNHAMADWEEDIPVIIKALMTQPFPELNDKKLPEIISFSRAQYKLAYENAELAIQGFPLKGSDQCALIAASRIVFEQKTEPAVLKKIQNKIIKKVLEIRTQGVRGTDKQDSNDLAAKKDKADQKAGEALFELFLKAGR